MNELLFFEDLHVGTKFSSSTYLLSKEEIVDFASLYDPQPFHTDSEKAEELFFKGHCASGWQTAAVTMRLLVTSVPLGCGIIGAGVDLTWLKPVRAGDVLQAQAEVKEINPSRLKPDRAIVTWLVETRNQCGEIVQTMQAKTIVLSKSTQNQG
ncbi:MAG: MaoC family dehydratase [Saezia sp.]